MCSTGVEPLNAATHRAIILSSYPRTVELNTAKQWSIWVAILFQYHISAVIITFIS